MTSLLRLFRSQVPIHMRSPNHEDVVWQDLNVIVEKIVWELVHEYDIPSKSLEPSMIYMEPPEPFQTGCLLLVDRPTKTMSTLDRILGAFASNEKLRKDATLLTLLHWALRFERRYIEAVFSSWDNDCKTRRWIRQGQSAKVRGRQYAWSALKEADKCLKQVEGWQSDLQDPTWPQKVTANDYEEFQHQRSRFDNVMPGLYSIEDNYIYACMRKEAVRKRYVDPSDDPEIYCHGDKARVLAIVEFMEENLDKYSMVSKEDLEEVKVYVKHGECRSAMYTMNLFCEKHNLHTDQPLLIILMEISWDVVLQCSRMTIGISDNPEDKREMLRCKALWSMAKQWMAYHDWLLSEKRDVKPEKVFPRTDWYMKRDDFE